jgi:hypothetical protein
MVYDSIALLKVHVNELIKANGNREITGNLLQGVLTDIIDTLEAEAQKNFWQINFFAVFDEVATLHEGEVILTVTQMSNIDTLEYSLDGGDTWEEYTIAFTVAEAINEVRWRVTLFTTGNDGTISIKAS